MTATTIDAARPATRLTATGIIRSEWVKLFTLRSTWWCLSIVAALTAGLPALISLALAASGSAGAPSADAAFFMWMTTLTIPLGFSVLAVPVLGCLVITGEYGTGMIRSTMAAVPRRVPALLAKALVIGVAVFLVDFVALAIGAAASGAILSAGGAAIDASDPRLWLTLLAAAGYPTLLGVFSVGVGALIRNSAGAIASVFGLLLVAPTVLQLAGALLNANWIHDVNAFLPSSLGSTMYSPQLPQMDGGFTMTLGTVALEPWQAALALAVWAAAALAAAAVVVRRRDV